MEQRPARRPGGIALAGASSLAQPRRHRPDYWLVILMALLITVGVVVVYSISPALAIEKNVSNNYYLIRQLIAVTLGAIMFVITARVPLSHWRAMYKALLGIAALATLVALAMPVNPQYPAHRWIRLGGLSFQSVELLKFALLVWFAGFLADRIRFGEIKNMQKTFQPIIYALVGVGLVVAGVQSDLGSTGVIVIMMAVMAYVAGLPMKRIFLIGGVIAIGLVLAVVSTPYRRERFATFLNPSSNCLSTGYQVCQALIAVGSGGMFGLGVGRSVQAYGYLPEAENDSIFAIYAEKFGFIGVAILLVLFAAFFSRLKNIAARAPDNFSRLVVIGVLVWLSAQALINIGAMLGLLPLKGITLPLFSYGGSSVLFVMAALGLVFQISHYTGYVIPEEKPNEKTGYDYRDDRRRIGGAYHPNPGSRT
ncbi:MAG TPA: putative peptidoglycan glycosyltransferase FtsW [Candidatus Saccharimonadales bacterium]|nr:putative peptidoglycan glycosyltransferase FtsW [Candidatus Saccharimonadales bacterium]